MQNQVHSKTTTLQGEILNTQLRHDTAMCHCLTATTVCLMLEIERIEAERQCIVGANCQIRSVDASGKLFELLRQGRGNVTGSTLCNIFLGRCRVHIAKRIEEERYENKR